MLVQNRFLIWGFIILKATLQIEKNINNDNPQVKLY